MTVLSADKSFVLVAFLLEVFFGIGSLYLRVLNGIVRLQHSFERRLAAWIWTLSKWQMRIFVCVSVSYFLLRVVQSYWRLLSLSHTITCCEPLWKGNIRSLHEGFYHLLVLFLIEVYCISRESLLFKPLALRNLLGSGSSLCDKNILDSTSCVHFLPKSPVSVGFEHIGCVFRLNDLYLILNWDSFLNYASLSAFRLLVDVCW